MPVFLGPVYGFEGNALVIDEVEDVADEGETAGTWR